MKVLLLSRYADLGASSRVRYLQYIPYLERKGLAFDIRPLFSNRYLERLYQGRRARWEVLKGYLLRALALLRARRFDVLIIEKELFPFMPAVAERLLKRAGVPYLVDYDDALFHNYDRHSNRWVRKLLGHKIDDVMRHANVVVVGNGYLAERARTAGATQVEIIPTVIDSERYAPASGRNAQQPVTVGWIGTPKTSHYLTPLLPVFERLQQKHGTRFVAVGANAADFAGTPVQAWPWSEDTEVASIQKLDIGIMPLVDSPWERGKCGYKLIQYMACGVPVVASPVGVNCDIVTEGENGFLADMSEEWEQRLEQLLNMPPDKRAEMGASARKTVMDTYCLAVQAPRLLGAIRDAGYMCGIAGFWGGGAPDAAVAEHMARSIRARGPDDAGIWIDGPEGLALAHRRLSILDLSPAGHQPMVSPCGRYVLVFNGEIYNHADLRDELNRNGAAFDWRGHSDTETLLAALRCWGVQGALERLNGMFAFALWDAIEHRLFLARDRMGEKPLYYGRSGDAFLFGSELKALAAHPDWQGQINRDALALYMRHNCVPAPWSIYKGITKLSPGHHVVVTDGGRVVGQPQCYWDLGQVAERGVKQGAGSPEALTQELDDLLRDAVKRRMAADVPLGVFLSGGYDSTTVAALMQAQSDRPVKTFSIGVNAGQYNEAEHAKAVARHLGTEHTELYVTPEDALAVIPKLPSIYDEPFSDSSQIPTFLVSQLARRHVTVALSGDGGDELFCGYNRHIVGPEIWGRVSRLPFTARLLFGRAVDWLAQRNLDRWLALLPENRRIPGLANKLEKLAEAFKARDGLAFYRSLASHWKDPAAIVIGATEPDTLLTQPERLPSLPGLREQMMYLDAMTYLPDDILTKVDRASMAVSLEARVPLLDHRVVEFAWRVPTEYKYRDGQSKWLLRQVLYRYVPRELMDRPKMGFGVPIEHWLRGPLCDWAEDLLDEKRLREEGFFDPAPIRRMWAEHVSGKRRWHYYLWDVLMFQAWLGSEK